MPETSDLLIEIGTEELPPNSVKTLSEAFATNIETGLEKANLAHGSRTVFATPRRLAVLISAVQVAQEERQIERRGPALSGAFDDQGAPTKAAIGFAGSCGVPVEHLEKLETDKGSWLAFNTTEVGQATPSLLPGIVEQALAGLPIRRRMRWGESDAEFVRPVHWIVILFGSESVPAELMGVTAGRSTYGHRFHQPNAMPIDEPSGYAALLYSTGYVVADFAARKAMIRTQVEETTNSLGGSPDIDEALLDEVASLVEWPVPIAGSFDEEFLKLPACVLIATMKGAQRYFHVANSVGRLLPKFITISNIESRRPQSVKDGNERVIRPRLKDAAFFFETDRRETLESRLSVIAEIKFHNKLGSMQDKSVRISKLAAHIAIAMANGPDDVNLARRAGMLSKCDLPTAMVGEFPELQGFIGAEYARHDNEAEVVATALGELYRPRFAGDQIPQSSVGRALAMADKLDTLTGVFAVGEQPTGDKDPFALRRAALGVLRILIEGKMNLDLGKLVDAALNNYTELTLSEDLKDNLVAFIVERLRSYFVDQGIPVDVFAAVAARKPSHPFDFARRMQAVDQFRQLPEAASLAAANKRIQNILKQVDETLPNKVDESLFSEDAEWNLAAKLVGLGPRVKDLLGQGNYNDALALLAGLRDAVDDFFDSVKVMDDDDTVRRNRLALLNNISHLFLSTADISQLQSSSALER